MEVTRTDRLEKAIQTLIPQHMQGGVRRYIYEGVPPGGFFEAVLMNNLVEAFARADSVNQAWMKNYADFLYNYAPLACWGNYDNIKMWPGLNNLTQEK